MNDDTHITTHLISEVARIIGLPIIPMAPTAVLDGQLFDPLANAQHFLLVEAWLERMQLAYQHTFEPRFNAHTFQIDGSGITFVFDKRPLAGCMALVHQFGDDRLVKRYFDYALEVPA